MASKLPAVVKYVSSYRDANGVMRMGYFENKELKLCFSPRLTPKEPPHPWHATRALKTGEWK